MITPLDIQNKEFKRSFRGYEVKDVDIFLDDVIEDYEKIYKENIDLKDKINALSEQIRQFNTMEETLKNTLILAQNTSDEVINSAKIKAQNIIKDSEINGNKIIDQAVEDVRKINNEFEYLKREMFSFKIKYESLINAQLISLENFFEEIEDNKTKDRPDEILKPAEIKEEFAEKLDGNFQKDNLYEELDKNKDKDELIEDVDDIIGGNNHDEEDEFIEE